jgi:hypothetical protein
VDDGVRSPSLSLSGLLSPIPRRLASTHFVTCPTIKLEMGPATGAAFEVAPCSLIAEPPLLPIKLFIPASPSGNDSPTFCVDADVRQTIRSLHDLARHR